MSTHLEPLAKTALGDAFDKLSEPVRRHYGLRCGAQDSITLKGVMKVHYPNRAWLLIMGARLLGGLVHKRGKQVAVTVRNETRSNHNGLFWHRTFVFPDKTVIFTSRMEHLADNEIVEFVGFGLGIRLRLSERDGALVFNSNGYLWRLGFLKLHLPDWLMLGTAEIIESPDGEGGVNLDFSIVHPWWGKTYDYSGQFSV